MRSVEIEPKEQGVEIEDERLKEITGCLGGSAIEGLVFSAALPQSPLESSVYLFKLEIEDSEKKALEDLWRAVAEGLISFQDMLYCVEKCMPNLLLPALFESHLAPSEKTKQSNFITAQK